MTGTKKPLQKQLQNHCENMVKGQKQVKSWPVLKRVKKLLLKNQKAMPKILTSICG